jgi:diketogulonate reductase-like aldo/keto reductase
MGLDYFDLYLIHFPISQRFVPFEARYPPEWIFDPTAENPKIELQPVPYSETWAGMEQLVDEGLVRNIGVANLVVCLPLPHILHPHAHPHAHAHLCYS